jgi:hypothetical protein
MLPLPPPGLPAATAEWCVDEAVEPAEAPEEPREREAGVPGPSEFVD